MEKETLLSTLKEKLGTTQLSDITLNAYIEGNMPSEGVEPDEAYWTKHTGFLKSLQGQYSNDVAKQIANQLPQKVADYYSKNPEALREYLSKHPEFMQDKPVETPPAADSKYEELMAQINELKNAQIERDKAASLSLLRNQVKNMAAINNLDVNDAMWEDAVNAANGENADEIYASAKTIYSTQYKRIFGDTAVPFETLSPFQPSGGGDNKTVNNFFAKKAKAEGWGK